jgi:hypothetical protein
MSAENRQRKNLSDYAKAKSYRQALDLGVFESAGALAEAEGISKSMLSQYLGFADLPGRVAAGFADITRLPYRTGYELSKACKTLGEEFILELIPKIESGELSRDDIQRLQVQAVSGENLSGGQADPPLEDSLTQTKPPAAEPVPTPKKRVLSSAGQALFTYNPASRGWLIRIPPDISSRMDESLMLEIGKLLEAHLNGGSK